MDKHPLQPGDKVPAASGGPTFRPGSPASSHSSYPTVHTQGDNSGEADKEHELNIRKYGDAYDPTAPMRVRNVPWNFDPDNDGRV